MAGIINSAQTAPNYTAQANQLYQQHLGRAGDAEGVNYWAGQLASGKSMDDVTNDFKNSARSVYSDAMNNPNSINANNPYIQGDLTQIGKTNAAAEVSNNGTAYGAPTGPLSAGRQQTDAIQGLKTNIYNDLYGGTTSGTGSGAQGGAPSTTSGAGGASGIIGKAQHGNGGSGNTGIVPPPASTVAPATGTGIINLKNGAYGYTAAQLGDPTKWNVDANQTVSGQIAGILNQNGPLMQQAEADARARSNSMGLANSSMAATAGQDALYRTALPIATQDASTYGKSASYNADESNQFKVNNATFQNQAAANTSSGGNQVQISQIGAAASEANAKLAAQTQLATANISASTQKYVSDQSAATQTAIAKMGNESQAAVSAAHDANSVLLQNNQSAQQAYSSYVNAVANIDIQTSMDAAAKAAAIQTQTNIFNSAIAAIKQQTSQTPDVSSPLNVNGQNATPVTQAISAVNGVDVSHMLDFGGAGA